MAVRRPTEPDVGEDVPVALRRLWGIAHRSRRGRPAQLDVARVVRAAVALADRDGLRGVSLPRIARSLGYTTMSLYRHVGSKDELLTLMRDVAVGVPPRMRSAPGQWRRALRKWAGSERLLYERRPWLARLPISAPPAGPNQIAWMEAALRALRGTRLGWSEKVGSVLLLSGYTRHSTLLAHDLEQGRRKTGANQAQAERRYGRSLARLVDAGRFPEAAHLFSSATFRTSRTGRHGDPTSDPDFVFGLERILDGIGVAIARRPKAR